MAQSFNGKSITITTNTRTEILEAVVPQQHVLHSIYVSNTDPVIDLTVDIEIERGISPGTYFYIGRFLPVPKGSVLVFDKPVNLMAGDKMYITSSTATGSIDVTLSSLIITP